MLMQPKGIGGAQNWLSNNRFNLVLNMITRCLIFLSLLTSFVPIVIWYNGWFSGGPWLTSFNVASLVWLVLTLVAVYMPSSPKEARWLFLLFPVAFFPALFGLWFYVAVKIFGFGR